MSEHDSYAVAEELSRIAHREPTMGAGIPNGSPDEAAFSLVVNGVAYTIVVRPFRYPEG